VSAPSRAPGPRDEAKGYLVTPMPPTPFGKYTLIGKLGHGGMAEVNLAVVGGKAGFRKLFVVKRLHAHLEAEPGFVDMFLDEARLAAQLDHPNCVQTVEVGEAEGPTPAGTIHQHFLAMEYLDGQGLERLLRITGQRGDVLPIALSVRMIADALDGLGYAHDLRGYDGTSLGVVHRDVSPQNIFVTYAGVVKLLDFGIAKAESNVVETRTGVVKGKYAYIAPEQALAAPVDRRADLWSMGVVLWEMLTSRRLFKSVNELATLNETLRGEIHAPSRYNPQIPPELDAVVLRALERDVERRYRTATEFKDALEAWLATQREQPDRKAIAALMRERFGDILEQHKERLRECIASVAQDPRSLDRLVLGGASTSQSMETDALTSGSHPGVPGPHASITPTPSPRPRLGLSVSGTHTTSSGTTSSGVTSGMPAMDAIAPRASAPPSSPHPALSSGTLPMHSSSGMRTTSSAEWSATSSPGFPVQPPAGISGAFGNDATTRIPPKRRAPSRSLAWWLVGAAACVVSAVVAIVTWSWMNGASAPEGTVTSLGPLPGPAQGEPSTAQGGPSTPQGEPSTAQGEPSTAQGGPSTAQGGPSTAQGGPAPPQPATGTITGPAPGVTPDPAPTFSDPSAEPLGPTLEEPEVARSGRPRGRRGASAGREPTVPSSAPTPVTPEPPPPTPEPERSPSHGPGYLSLVTSPWTNVTLDGRALGETPLVRVSLPAGTHTLRLRNPEAGIDESYEVTIRSGETTTRRLGLR
jgi:serine/threonine-protein kinase